MNHYIAATIRNRSVQPILVNYADGSPVDEDAKFLTNDNTSSNHKLFRILSILSKPRNQFDYEYKGEIDGLHHFMALHQDSYTTLDQFVVDGSIFHVKKVDSQNIHAVRCSGMTAIPAIGKLHSSVLPIKHLEFSNDSIVFEFHGVWFRITSDYYVRLYLSELQCKTLSASSSWKSYTESVQLPLSQFAIVFGENDFGIIGGNRYSNSTHLSTFFYARNDTDRIVVLTADNACIAKNGNVEFFSITAPTQTSIGGLPYSETINKFIKAPIYLRGNRNTTVQTSLIWGIQDIRERNTIALSENNEAVCSLTSEYYSYAFIAFAIGENR